MYALQFNDGPHYIVALLYQMCTYIVYMYNAILLQIRIMIVIGVRNVRTNLPSRSSLQMVYGQGCQDICERPYGLLAVLPRP